MTEAEQEQLRHQLYELQIEHRDLDGIIAHLHETGGVDPLKLQRMKKRKLRLKDQISKIEDLLIPNILA